VVITPPGVYTGATELYDGTSWTTSPTISTARSDTAGAGTTTQAALAFGGFAPARIQQQQKNGLVLVLH
jgi:hypothetical protein